MKKRTMSLILSTALMLSVGLTACSNGDEKTGTDMDKKGKEEITFMIPEWGVPSDKMLEEFTTDTGIKVNVETVAWDDIRNKISVAANGKKAPADVVEVDWSWVGEFDSAGWLEPITVDAETMKDMPSISSFKEGDKVILICDVISTGFMVNKLEIQLKRVGASLDKIGVLVDAIDPLFKGVDYSNIKNKLITLYPFVMKKFHL